MALHSSGQSFPLHDKFVAWDDDDLVVKSLNWASASANFNLPWKDVGVQIRSKGMETVALSRLEDIFPGLSMAAEPANVAR